MKENNQATNEMNENLEKTKDNLKVSQPINNINKEENKKIPQEINVKEDNNNNQIIQDTNKKTGWIQMEKNYVQEGHIDKAEINEISLNPIEHNKANLQTSELVVNNKIFARMPGKYQEKNSRKIPGLAFIYKILN